MLVGSWGGGWCVPALLVIIWQLLVGSCYWELGIDIVSGGIGMI
ncbi:hypothetical protein [Microcoleus sp.]